MNHNLQKYKKTRIILSALLVVVLLIGTSFAIFQSFARQTTTNDISSLNCFTVSFEGVNNAINLENDYPIPDDEGLERTPYTFKVTNNCNQYLTLSIGVETLSTSEIPASLIKGVIIKNGEIPTSAMLLSSGKVMEAQNGGKAYELLTDSLSANTSKTYDLRLWFNESMTKEQGASKKYLGKVIIGSSAAMPTLVETILANNEIKAPITIPGRETPAYSLDDAEVETNTLSTTQQSYYVTYGTGWEANGTKFNLTGTAVTSDTYVNSYSSIVGKYLVASYGFGSSTAGKRMTTTGLSSVYYVVSATSSSFTYKQLSSNKNVTEALLASTEDDYGTSYYFRGAVKNNYIEFANKCWRIVRIVGDGSVKLVLHNNNTSNVTNPCSSTNNSDTAAVFSSSSITTWNDNAYVGFMYGSAGASNYTDAHTNINKSSILVDLETWFKNNLTNYDSYLADTIWCNDKSTFTTYTSGSTYGTGLGYGTKETGYGANNRLYGGDAASYASPSLICPNDNNGGKLSKFTVEDTINGNGDLTYKIGLLTADEVVFAGYVVGKCATSGTIYLAENIGVSDVITMSPSYLSGSTDIADGDGAKVFFINGYLDQQILYAYGQLISVKSLRPAVSLKSSITISGGSGTSEDPYIVK